MTSYSFSFQCAALLGQRINRKALKNVWKVSLLLLTWHLLILFGKMQQDVPKKADQRLLEVAALASPKKQWRELVRWSDADDDAADAGALVAVVRCADIADDDARQVDAGGAATRLRVPWLPFVAHQVNASTTSRSYPF